MSEPFVSPTKMTPSRRGLAVSPSGPLVIHQPGPYDLLLREMNDLKTRLRETEEELDEALAELKETRSQRDQDASTITRLGMRNAELEDLVNRQKMTISNQSRTISDPKALRNRCVALPLTVTMLPAPPHKHTTQHSYEASISNSRFHAPAPGSDLPPPVHTAPPSSSTHRQPLMSPPVDSMHMHAHTCRFGPHDGRAAIRDLFSGPSVLAPKVIWFQGINFEQKVTEFGARFQGLWTKSEAFGRAYAGEPSAWNDSHLDPRVKDYILSTSDSKVAWHMLSNPVTRPLQIAKAINFYIVRDILRITVIKGFDFTADHEISQIRRHLFPDTATTLRNMMITAMSQQVKAVKEKPGFQEFYKRRQQDHLLKLWQFIAPLISGDMTKAGEALGEIIIDAHVLSLDLYSTPFETRLHIPETDEAFDPVTMTNVDPWLALNGNGNGNGNRGAPNNGIMHGSIRRTRSIGHRVKLGITPVTRIADHSNATPSASSAVLVPRVRLVHLGKVLLRLPGNNDNNNSNNHINNNSEVRLIRSASAAAYIQISNGGVEDDRETSGPEPGLPALPCSPLRRGRSHNHRKELGKNDKS